MSRPEETQRQEFKAVLRSAETSQPLIEPTADEARNGWTRESLTRYHAEQRAAQAVKIDPHSVLNRQARRPQRANGRYRPQRWRG